MGTIFSRVKLSGKHVAALLALMLLSAVTAMLLPTALASMIDIGVAGENRNTILIIAAVMATLAILGCLFNMAATVLSAKVSTKFAADLRREIFHQVQDFSAAEMERFGTASLVTRSTSDVTNIQMFLSLLLRLGVTAPLIKRLIVLLEQPISLASSGWLMLRSFIKSARRTLDGAGRYSCAM